MSRFGTRVSSLEGDSATFTLEIFERLLPQSEVEEILHACGRASRRRRALPAGFVVRVLLAAWLWRSVGLVHVVGKLGRGFLAPLAWMKRGRAPGSAALARARARLGLAPLRRMFRRMVGRWWPAHAPALRWRGMPLLSLDGTTLRMQDTPANRRHFGTHPCRKVSASAYPFARVLVAACLASHVVLEFAVGKVHASEGKMARALLPNLPRNALLVLDRGFLNYALLLDAMTLGHAFVVRAKKGLRMRRGRRLGPNDHIVRITLSPALRRARADLPASFEVRRIRYRIPGFRPVTLFTSLLDATAFPAGELRALYHQRWDIELAFDEIKTHLVAAPVHLRSLRPAMVRQEIEALMLTYNAVRMHMATAALQAGREPTRLSFTAALEAFRETLRVMALSPTRLLPWIYADYLAALARQVLPPRRPRSYPRERKGYGSTYKTRKKPRAA
jgi:hypothetical protein